ncbi:hypothetical protein F183_A28320 [Bryobacterales bacterium F-183]|nr:hypothetical protein F183_A28320 [Bryobacterales bacterium F-183]
MKDYTTAIGTVMLCSFTLISVGCAGYARGPVPRNSFAATLPEAPVSAVISTDLKGCESKTPVVSRSEQRSYPEARIQRTLNGVWRGKVTGEYPKDFLARDGNLDVDYYMIVDAKRGEALVFEQFSSKRAAPKAKANAPKWSYLMCGHERYLPAHPPQVHEFQKVSDNIEDARELLAASTGLTFKANSDLVLSSAWKQLVDSKYFDSDKSLAYAGGLFKPFRIANVPDEERGSLLEMKIQAEYRGSGMTAAKFEKGVAMRGTEEGKFVGIRTGGSDYLVAAAGSGSQLLKQVSQFGSINMAFDKVVIGPLAN